MAAFNPFFSQRANVPVVFKLDTGAEVTVIPENVFKKTGIALQKVDTKLTDPGQYKLQVLGITLGTSLLAYFLSISKKRLIVFPIKT